MDLHNTSESSCHSHLSWSCYHPPQSISEQVSYSYSSKRYTPLHRRLTRLCLRIQRLRSVHVPFEQILSKWYIEHTCWSSSGMRQTVWTRWGHHQAGVHDEGSLRLHSYHPTHEGSHETLGGLRIRRGHLATSGVRYLRQRVLWDGEKILPVKLPNRDETMACLRTSFINMYFLYNSIDTIKLT